MHNLPLERLAALLRANAKGVYASEAAAELLIRHASWLRRSDFLVACVEVEHDHEATWAWVDWQAVPAFLEDAVFASSEGRILRLAAELAGTDSGLALADLLAGLDAHNSRLVVAAIAHALHTGPAIGWPIEVGHVDVLGDLLAAGKLDDVPFGRADQEPDQ